ncbi:MAG: ferritin [Firmicutes bacterium]|nr:ferritin [Bacillota bacterium]
MLSAKVKDLLNAQVNAEFYSAYLYLDFSNYYKDEGLDGYANWYYIQAQEERDHAMLFIQYLQQNGEPVVLEAIDKPDMNYGGFIDPLKEGAKHERHVTDLINTIYAAAHEEKDFRTMQFLDWFVKEQAEEEDNADNNVQKFELFGGDAKGLYMLDNELKARVYAAPSLVLD